VDYSRDTVAKVWAKARPVYGVDPNKFRQDERGALISRERYACRWSPLGWEIEVAWDAAYEDRGAEPQLAPVHWERARCERSEDGGSGTTAQFVIESPLSREQARL